MRVDGMTDGYSNVIYSGDRDWRSFDARIMEKVLIVNLIIGIITLIPVTQFINDIYKGISNFSLVYFMSVPFGQYYRDFKTDYGLYIYMVPIKKSHILFTSLKIWIKGLGVFLVLRILIGIFRISLSYTDISLKEFITSINPSLLVMQILQIVMVITSIYMVAISVDIIAVVKGIPAIITIGVAIGIGYAISLIPGFITYSSWEKTYMTQFIIDPTVIIDHGSKITTTVEFSGVITLFIVSLVAFVYAMRIFEGYSYDHKKHKLISIGKFKKSGWITVLVIIITLLGISYLLGMNTYSRSTTIKSELIVNSINIDRSLKQIKLSDMAGFEWDRAYSFKAYIPRDEIYKTIGFKWDGVQESISEGMNNIVFVKSGEVVHYEYGYPGDSGFYMEFKDGNYKDGVFVINKGDKITFSQSIKDGISCLKQN